MDPVTISLIIGNVVSYLLHGVHYHHSKKNHNEVIDQLVEIKKTHSKKITKEITKHKN